MSNISSRFARLHSLKASNNSSCSAEGACVRLKEADQEIEEQRKTYMDLIAENEEIIREYNKIVESLTEQNRNYRGIVANLKVKHDIADKEVRDTVAVLIGKKVF